MQEKRHSQKITVDRCQSDAQEWHIYLSTAARITLRNQHLTHISQNTELAIRNVPKIYLILKINVHLRNTV